MSELKAGVASAIKAIEDHFRGHQVRVYPAVNGGANVIVEEVPLGHPYNQASTWVGFFLSDACPHDDTYPFYVTDKLSRIDGAALRCPPLHAGQQFPAAETSADTRPAIMVSRRQLDPNSLALETPLLKLKTVLKWMMQQ